MPVRYEATHRARPPNLDVLFKRFLPSDQPIDWVVPEGVTRIVLRASGGSGGGSDNEPGEDGDYLAQEFEVSPGDVLSIRVGAGGKAIGAGVPGLDGFVEVRWVKETL